MTHSSAESAHSHPSLSRLTWPISSTSNKRPLPNKRIPVEWRRRRQQQLQDSDEDYDDRRNGWALRICWSSFKTSPPPCPCPPILSTSNNPNYTSRVNTTPGPTSAFSASTDRSLANKLLLLLLLVNIIPFRISHSALVPPAVAGTDLWPKPSAVSPSATRPFDADVDQAVAVQQNKDNQLMSSQGWQQAQAAASAPSPADAAAPAPASNQWPPIGDYSNLASTLNMSLSRLELVGGTDEQLDGDGGLGLAGVRRQLIRQLTSLIMNHEPERIAKRMEGTRISGQLVSESELIDGTTMGSLESSANTLISEIQQQQQQQQPRSEAPEQQQQPSMLTSGSGTSFDGGDGGGLDNFVAIQDVRQPEDLTNNDTSLEDTGGVDDASKGSSANAAEEQYVTCPPDYEDSSMIVEPSSNLTMEQQQQLLADSSGLLTGNGSAGGTQLADPEAPGAGGQQQVQQNSRPPQGPCIMPGSRMIEVITKVITPILFSIIIVVGLVGNIVVMIVILDDRKTERELTPTGLLILDLSLADLSFIIFCIPFTAWDYSVGHWVFGSLWCKFNQYLIVVCALSSIYTLVLMSVDRFMAIVYPIECMSYRTSKNTLNAIYIKWILILAMASPTIAMHGLIDSPAAPDQFTCRFLADQYNPLHFQIVFFITSYLFPLILIFCLYWKLLNKLWFGSKPHGHKESLKTLESKKKVTWLVAGIVVVFALCWCPIQVMLILMRLRSHKITATYVAIQVFSHTLGYMNSCVNPIVYAFASETFHNSFKRSPMGRFFYRFVCCCCKNNHHPLGATNNNNDHHSHVNNNNDHDRNSNTNFRFIHSRGSDNTNSNTLNHTHQRPHRQQQALDTGHRPSRAASASFDIENTPIPVTDLQPTNGFNETKMVSLPLEPRDRLGFTRSGILDSSNQLDSSGGLISGVPEQHDKARGGIHHQNDTESYMGGTNSQQQQVAPAKQQLVAHMVQSGNQVSHRCEPCYQQELLESTRN